MSSQVMPEWKKRAEPAIVMDRPTARFANFMAGLRSIRIQ
jgi:hypothetical protein